MKYSTKYIYGIIASALVSTTLMANGDSGYKPGTETPEVSQAQPAVSDGEPKNFQSGFYAGAAGGWSHIGGHRRDTVPDLDENTTTVLFDGRFTDDNIQAILVLGYLQRIASTGFVVALEPFFGYGPFNHDIGAIQNIEGIQANIRESSILERTFIYGVLAKLGYVFWDCVMVYGTAGFESGRFKHTFKDEENKLTRKTGNVNSFAFGGGVETEIKTVRVGLEFKRNLNSTRTFSTPDPQLSIHTGVSDNEINRIRFSSNMTSVLLRLTVPIKKLLA
jgi:hypothetical protein